MFDIKIEYTDSFYLKTDPTIYKEGLRDVIKYVAEDIVKSLKTEAPVRTGRLRDGHYSRLENLNAYIGNNVPYAKYVIYGTSRMAPNNYPSRVLNHIGISDKSASLFEESLIMRGVL